MRSVLFAVCLSVALTGCSNSTVDTSTPVAACRSLASTVCNRAFVCDNAGATAAFGSVSSCTTTVEGNQFLDCAAAACPAGTTYNGANAASCISGIAAISCSAFSAGNVPPLPATCNQASICP